MLVDQYGATLDPYLPPKDPLSKSTATEARAIYRDIPLVSIGDADWSPGAIRCALSEHMQGQFAASSSLVDAVVADDRVQATLGSRTGGLFSQPVKHRAGRKNRLGRKCRAAWRAYWPTLASQAVMSEIVRWAVMIGFALCEIQWDTSVTPWRPYLKPWHPQYIYYRWDIRRYVALTQDGAVIVEPGDGKWFLYTPHGPYRGWAQAAVRGIAQPWLFKQYAWRDWARFNERHGLPIIKAYVPASGDPAQKRNFVASMQTLGQEAVVGLPQNVDETGYDLELLEARDRAWESFLGQVDRADRSIVLPILWQNLTTEVKEGSFAAARVHGDVRQNAIEFDNATLSEAIHEQLARPFAYLNFGDADAATRTTWDVTPPEDFAVKAETFLRVTQGLQQLRQAGFAPDDIGDLAKQFGFAFGDLHDVEPLQVQAKAAGAASKDIDNEE